MLLQKLIWYISVWSVLLPFLTGALLYRRLGKSSRTIFYIVAAAIPPQLLTLVYAHSDELNVLYNIYTIVEFGLVCRLIVSPMLKKSGAAPWIPIPIFLIMICYSVLSQGMQSYFNEWVCLANIIYLYWIFLFVLYCLKNEMRLLNTGLPIFWYISALLLYAPCTIFVFSLYSYIDGSGNPFIHQLWSIHGIFNTLMYVLFTIGLAQNRKKMVIRDTFQTQ